MKQKLSIILALLLIIAAAVIMFSHHQSDKCTNYDREIDNCIPAGQCLPPSYKDKGIYDCELKKYDHKLRTDT